MATGTGLDAQLGLGEESTVGTAVTPTNFLEFNSESLAMQRTNTEPAGLHPGQYAMRASRVREARRTVSGSVSLDVATVGMSLLFKHCVGSTTAAAETLSQSHAWGGTFVGKGLTVQVGRPAPSGTVTPFTYSGCKVASWEFSVNDGDPAATLSVDLDGRDVTTATALASASYPAASIYSFADVSTFTIGGSAPAGIIKGITIRGENPWANERYGLGNQGLKAEQLLNGIPHISGSLTAEFDPTEYANFISETDQALVLALTNGSSSLTFTVPAARWMAAAPQVGGPDVVEMTLDFEGLDNGTDDLITIDVVNTAA